MTEPPNRSPRSGTNQNPAGDAADHSPQAGVTGQTPAEAAGHTSRVGASGQRPAGDTADHTSHVDGADQEPAGRAAERSSETGAADESVAGTEVDPSGEGHDGSGRSDAERRNRRTYLLALVACLAGAGLAAYGATRTWSVEVTPRPEMSDLRVARAGVDVAPWVIGLALVGLAGTGALLATHGWLRRALGGLLTLAGVGVAISAIAGRAGLDTGDAGAGGTVWPIVCVIGGVIVALGGLTAVRFGHQWPRMSARYDRTPAPENALENAPADVNKPVDNRAAWDSLDRGDDPTV